MQAVIMAGGKGTRLGSIAQNIPKPMVTIDGKPLLEYQIDNIKDNGITDVILVVGYLGDVIKGYFGNGSKWNINIHYYFEKTPLGTAGALAQINKDLEENFVLIFGDLFIDINLKKFFAFHTKKQALISLFAHPNSHPYDSDIIIADKNGKVNGWICKNVDIKYDYKNLVNAGIYVINKKIVDYIISFQNKSGRETVDLEKDVIIPSINWGRIFAYCSTEYVKDIGTPKRFEKVKKDFRNSICSYRNLKNKQKCIFLDRDGTINKYVGLLKAADQVELESGAAEAIRYINESKYLAIVITNQSVIARGISSFEELERIHNRMYTLLGNEGSYVDDLYYCPHHPHSGYEGEVKELKIDCECRKPKIGMLKQAADKYNIDIKNSWFVGDTGTDVRTGINAGMRTCLLKSGDPNKYIKYHDDPHIYADNLLDAVKKILRYEGEI